MADYPGDSTQSKDIGRLTAADTSQGEPVIIKRKILWGEDGQAFDVTPETPFPVTNVSPSDLGTPVHIRSGLKETIPSTPVELILFTNPLTPHRHLKSVKARCTMDALIEIIDDGVVIGSGMTGPGESNFVFIFDPEVTLTPETNFLIQISALLETAPTDVEAYLMANDF